MAQAITTCSPKLVASSDASRWRQELLYTMTQAGPPDIDFCRTLPKVELHAHLTGSITQPILQEIWDRRSKEPDFDVESPATAFRQGTGQDISSFFGHFNSYIYRLVSDLPSLIYATRAVLQMFQDDGVVYLELRTTPRQVGSAPSHTVISGILEVIEEWNDRESMKVGLILSIDQAKHDAQKALSIVSLAAEFKFAGRPVVGVDLCGDPHNVPDMTIFRPAFTLAREKGLGIVLHFAEVPEISSREVLMELLSWQPRRLGHAIHVPEDIRREIVERGIAVELCLTCNVLAGMLPSKGSFADHHFGDWWNGSPEPMISLGTDDVGVFGSLSSQEYLLAAEHFDLSRTDLLKVSKCALKGSLGDPRFALEAIEKYERELREQ